MSAVRQLRTAVGVRTACQALGSSRSGYYRRQRPPRKRTEVPRTSLLALAGSERTEVLEVMHSARFCDRAPTEIYATLLDEGR